MNEVFDILANSVFTKEMRQAALQNILNAKDYPSFTKGWWGKKVKYNITKAYLGYFENATPKISIKIPIELNNFQQGDEIKVESVQYLPENFTYYLQNNNLIVEGAIPLTKDELANFNRETLFNLKIESDRFPSEIVDNYQLAQYGQRQHVTITWVKSHFFQLRNFVFSCYEQTFMNGESLGTGYYQYRYTLKDNSLVFQPSVGMPEDIFTSYDKSRNSWCQFVPFGYTATGTFYKIETTATGQKTEQVQLTFTANFKQLDGSDYISGSSGKKLLTISVYKSGTKIGQLFNKKPDGQYKQLDYLYVNILYNSTINGGNSLPWTFFISIHEEHNLFKSQFDLHVEQRGSYQVEDLTIQGFVTKYSIREEYKIIEG